MIEWKIGDSYKIIENDIVLVGIIIDIKKEGYIVKWSDGEETLEIKIDPIIKK